MNVKEQGRLLRQNEFLVWQGKGKKCLRQVFLFEDLILFSKARRFPDRKVRFSKCHFVHVSTFPFFSYFIKYLCISFRILTFISTNIVLRRRISVWPLLSQTRPQNSRSGFARGNQVIHIHYNVQAKTSRRPGLRNLVISCGNRRFETEVIRYLCLVLCQI